jgi:hypothetical protein
MKIERADLVAHELPFSPNVDLQVMARLAGLNIGSDLGNQAALFFPRIRFVHYSSVIIQVIRSAIA